MVIIFGTGHTAQCLMEYKEMLNIKYFIDNSKEKQEGRFNGYNVYAPLKLKEESDDSYEYIIIASEQFAYSMKKQCIEILGIKKEKIIIFHERDITPWYISGEIAKVLSDDDITKRKKDLHKKAENAPFCVTYSKDKKVTFFLYGEGYTGCVLEYLNEKYNAVIVDDDRVSGEEYSNGIHIICDEMEYATPEETTIYLSRYIDLVYLNNRDFWDMLIKYQGQKKDIKAIITGMSYFRDAFNCELLKIPAVKLTCSSQDLFYDFMMFKEIYQKTGEGVNHVFIGLAPYSLRYDLSLASSIEYLLFSYYSCLHTFHNNKKLDQIGKFIDDQKAKIEGNIDEHICEYIYEQYTRRNDEKLWETFQLDSLRESDYMEVEEEFNKPYQATLEENKLIIEEYISYCTSRNISVYLVIPPFTNWYKEHWKQSYCDELKMVIRDLRNKYEFTLLDFSEQDWEDKYFYNNGHLNMYGARRFMNILNTYLTPLAK